MHKQGLTMIPDVDLNFYIHALPILALLGGALLLMLFAVSRWLADPSIIFISTVTFIVGALLSSLLLPINWLMFDQRSLSPFMGFNLFNNSYSIFGGSYLVDGLAVYGQVLILVIGLTICLLIKGSRLAERFFRGDIACLFVLTLAGMAIMVSSINLLTIFVGLEIFSLGTYALIGYIEPSRHSQEAAIKYFVLGSFAAALLLFGFAFIYAGTGSLNLATIAERLTELPSTNLIRIAAVFIITGLAFKLALVPCHLWTPDAYQGAPTAITAFMATTAKAVVILLAIRLLMLGITDIWLPVVILFAGLSMIVGNIMALAQTSIKRLFAYSSIAHGGYMALALAALAKSPALSEFARAGDVIYSITYYIQAYCLMSLGAFAVIIWLEKKDDLQIDDLAGLAKDHPFASFSLAAFALAFAGMPPTVGFFAKFLVFEVALSAELYALVVIAAIGSGISFFYYLRLIVQMYFCDSDDRPRLGLSKIVATVVGGALLMTMFGGLLSLQ